MMKIDGIPSMLPKAHRMFRSIVSLDTEKPMTCSTATVALFEFSAYAHDRIEFVRVKERISVVKTFVDSLDHEMRNATATRGRTCKKCSGEASERAREQGDAVNVGGNSRCC